MTDQQHGGTIASPGTRLASIVDPAQFERELERRWQTAATLKNVVSELVSDDLLDAQDGFGLMACVTGQLFGYRWFHGESSPTDLASALQQKIRQQN